MKLETVKRNNKKNIIIGSMVVLSVLAGITLTTTRAKYRSVQSLKLASGIVKLNSYDFKIVAMKQSEDGENYTGIDTMPESGYIINEEKSYCTTDNKTQVKGKLKTNSDGEHMFSKLNKNDKCYIWFDKKKTGSDMIIANIEKSGSSYKGTGTPTFTSVATGTEIEANNGIYKVSDGMYNGYSYYWRGAATTNHVIFDNKCWRIVRINGDKTIRLIYNGEAQSGNTCKGNGSWDGNVVLKNTAYNSSYNNSSYVGWTYTVSSQRPSAANPQTSGTAAPLKTALESWYSSNISATAKAKVVLGKFCNDRNTKNNETWRATGATQYYVAYARLIENKTPTLSCPNGDVYLLDVGMITADEVTFAGASGETINTSYYLYNGQYYWTISPKQWHSNSNYAWLFIVRGPDGYLSSTNVGNTNMGVRPVINLRSDVTFNAGSDGTKDNPYVVIE